MAKSNTEAGKLNGWGCQRVRYPSGRIAHFIERADGVLYEVHERNHRLRANIDAAIDGVPSGCIASDGTRNETEN